MKKFRIVFGLILAAAIAFHRVLLPLPPGEGWGEGVLEFERRLIFNTPSPLPSPGGRGGQNPIALNMP
jgi:hypothetical protein